MTIGERIRKCRKGCGMTQNDLANAIKMHVNTIRQWEKGHTSPDADALNKISEALNTSIAYLTGEIDNKNYLNSGMTNVHNGRGNISGNSFYEAQSGTVYFSEPPKGMAFWGMVSDAAEAVARRKDFREVSLVVSLLKDATENLENVLNNLGNNDGKK